MAQPWEQDWSKPTGTKPDDEAAPPWERKWGTSHAAPPKAQDGQAVSGFKRSFQEVPGLLAGVGAFAADAVGADEARDSMLSYAKRKSDEVGAAHANDAQSITDAWDGKVAWGDFLANAAGYVAGQALQSILTGGAGALGAKMLANQGIKQVGVKVAAEQIAAGATEQVAKAAALKAMTDAGTKAAVRGGIAGATAQNLNMELGSIYPDAVEEAGGADKLDGGDRFRVLSAAALAAGVDTAGEALTALKWLKGSNAGGKTILARAAKEVPMGMAREAGTEAIQTGIEQYGAAKSYDLREIVDSAGIGAVGGGLGGAAAARTKREPDVGDVLGAGSVDDAINKAKGVLALPAPASGVASELVDGVLALPGPPTAPRPTMLRSLPAPDGGTIYMADEAGNVAPQPAAARAEAITRQAEADIAAAQQAAAERQRRDSLGKQTPRGAEPVERIPTGEATTFDALPTGEVSEAIPTGDATELEPIPAGEASELDVETIQMDDLLARDGEPFTSKTGAQAKAYASGGGKVVAIPDHFGSGIPGYVVRPLMPGRPSNTRGTDARDLPRSSNDDQRDLAGSAEQVPGASDGRGADAARSGGVVGLVPDAPGRVDQPAEAPSASNRPADVVAGAGDADTALTPGSRVTLNGTPYTVTAANSTAVKLQGADGGVKMVARNSRTFQAIQQEPNEAARQNPQAAAGEGAAAAAAPAPAAGAVVPGAGSAAVEADGVKPTVRTFGSSGYQLTMAQALAKVSREAAQRGDRRDPPQAFTTLEKQSWRAGWDQGKQTGKPTPQVPPLGAAPAPQPTGGEAAPAPAPEAAPAAAPAPAPERTPKAQAVKEALAAKKGVQPAPVATHKDPGEPAEPVTPAVVREAIKTGVQATDRKPSAMKAELLAKIDAAIADAPDEVLPVWKQPTKDQIRAAMVGMKLTNMDRAEQALRTAHDNRVAEASRRIGHVNFSVEGDGQFKVLNSKPYLEEFRRKVAASPGFKAQRPGPLEGPRDGGENGSGGKVAAFDNMVNEGDLEAASDYADAVGLELDPKKLANATKVLKWRETRPAPAPEAAAQPEAEAPAPAAEPVKIDDAGEKIGGARKDLWRDRGLNVADLDAMSESEGATLVTKANVWKPDYAAIAEASEPVTAAMVKVVYDQLAAQPKKDTPEGRRDYVKAMQAVRKVYGGVTTPEQAKEAYRQLRAELGVEIRSGTGFSTATDPEPKRVLFSVYKGRSDPFVFGYNELARARKLVQEGFPGAVEPWTRRYVVRPFGGAGTTAQGLTIYVDRTAEAGTPLTREQIAAGAFEVRSKTGGPVAYAATREDAEAAAKAVYERTKGSADAKEEPDRPHLDKVARENLPQRIDREVTPELLLQEFGFRGVEFGNWAAQDERRKVLALAYDALADLATIVGVPNRALSLNGTMGLAFGARGGGKFAAHYEPGKLVINMTKLRGAGSLAHEWAHALDHYLGELDRTDAYKGKARGASGWYSQDSYTGQPRQRMVQGADGKWAPTTEYRMANLRPELAAQVDAVMKRLYETPIPQEEALAIARKTVVDYRAMAERDQDPRTKSMYAEGAEKAQRIVDDLEAGKPSDRTKRSSFATEAQRLSGKKSDGYWVRPTEMLARAFESYVFDRLMGMGAKSEYLVHGVEQDRYSDGTRYKGNPYPTGAERAAINGEFAKLFDTLKTRADDAGNVALFSRRAKDDTGRSGLSVLQRGPDEGAGSQVERGAGQGGADATGLGVAGSGVGDLRNGREQLAGLVADGAVSQGREGSDGAGTLSRAEPSRTGVPMADAKAVVATIREALPTAPEIVLHDSVRRAPDNLRRLIRQAGADNDVEAVYHDGEIHVFPGNIASIERMQFVVAHHEVRHHGLRSMLGPQMGPAMLRMYASNANLKAAADAKMAAGLADTRILAVEEALADMPVEELQKLTGWARIVAAARQWLRQAAAKLRRAGLNTLADAMEPEGWTDNDIAALVQRAEDVSRGGAAPFRTGGTVFSGPGDQTQTPDTRPQAVRAVQTMPRSPLTGRPVFDLMDAAGNRIETQHHAKTADEALENYRERPARQDAARAAAPAPTYAMPEKAAKAEGSNWRRVRGQEFTSLDEDDGYLYHVTSAPAAAGVREQGLVPNAGGMFGGFYANYSAGKVFLTERSGVSYWQEKVGQQLEAAMENPPAVTVLRIPKDKIKAKLLPDTVGSGDARAPAFYSNEAVFSRAGTAKTTAQDLVNSTGGVFDFNRLGETKQDRLRTIMDAGRPGWLGLLTRDQIADVYGQEIAPVKEYDQLTREMENQRSKIAQDADDLYNEWAKLPAETNDKLARLMLDATVYSVHPDGAFTKLGKPNDAERQQVHARLKAQYALMGKDGQAIYGKVRDFHKGTLEQLRDALEARVTRQVENGQAKAAALTKIRQAFDAYLKEGPYFPLSRFGDFIVVGARDADGERVVASYATAGEQAAAARTLEADGFTVKMKTAKTYSRETDGSAGKFIGDVLTTIGNLDMLDATVGGDVAGLQAKLMDDVNQLFIKALPDLSYRKHFMHRKGTPGFSSDMMRGFASSAFHAASHIARLNHGDRMTFALQDAFTAIEQAPAGDFNLHSQVLNELTKRHDAALNPNTHPVAAMLNQVGFVMYLGLSPAAGLINMLQTVMVTMPHLGARYGFGKANASLAAALADITTGAKANAKNGWNAAQSTKLTAAERTMMSELQDEGVIDLTQAHDLSAATGLDTGNVARSKAAFAMARAMKIVGWTFHIPEVMNRQVTALSAYRLEMEKTGDAEKAKDAAREAIKRTHFDYSSSNRARFMQGNVARVLLQFKQYSQNMTYLLGRAAYQALKGESPEVRSIARRQLVATFGVTWAMAGALGLPGLGAVAGLIGMLVGAMDDDDEPYDWKVEFRNLLADNFGKEAGEVLSHGIPRALLPWDISNRVSLGDLWFRDSGREGQSPREAFATDAANILGPTAGTVLGLYTAADHMARGNWSKAAESVVPKFLRDPLKAIREGSDGVTSYNGEPLMDLTGAEVAGRLLGFAPARASEMYEGKAAVMNAKTAIEEKRQSLISRMAKARIDKDTDTAAELQPEIAAFNERNPEFKITGATLAKAIMTRMRNRRNTEDGILLPRTKDSLRELGRFAEVD